MKSEGVRGWLCLFRVSSLSALLKGGELAWYGEAGHERAMYESERTCVELVVPGVCSISIESAGEMLWIYLPFGDI